METTSSKGCCAFFNFGVLCGCLWQRGARHGTCHVACLRSCPSKSKGRVAALLGGRLVMSTCSCNEDAEHHIETVRLQM
eukprot:4102153-Amphidinium_carterae.1